MTAVVRRTTLEPIFTDNIGKYDVGYYWIDPDLSAVLPEPYKYWQEIAGVFSLVDQAARDVIDVAENAAEIAAEKGNNKRKFAKDKVLLAFIKILIKELNTLRAEHSLNPRTLAQLKAAIESEIENE